MVSVLNKIFFTNLEPFWKQNLDAL